MKAYASSFRHIFLASVICSGLFPNATLAQPLQREWVKDYFNVQTKFNQASAIAIAPDGNIIVAGTSQNAAGDLDYEIIKYKPNGDEAWKARYGSPGSGNDQLRGMTIDPNGNIIVTGTSQTVKFNSAGAFVWAAPLGGRALIANTDYVYVTGFSDTDIATAQLYNNAVDGRESWRRLIDGRNHGEDVGQAITLDENGNIFVAGQEKYDPCTPPTSICHYVFAAVSYTPNGTQRWFADAGGSYPASNVEARSIIVRSDGSVYVYGSYQGSITAVLMQFSAAGWIKGWNYINLGPAETGTKMLVDRVTGKVALTGRGLNSYGSSSFNHDAFVITIDTDANEKPNKIWSYSGDDRTYTQGNDIAQDSHGDLYITGYAPDGFSDTMFLAKISNSGQQLGLDRFNSPNAGNNYGTALAIDSHDNVYVTGYVLNTLGGSEFVTIKYSAAPKIEKKPNGAMHLEFHTSPGQPYAIEATTNFFDWQSLVTNTADANGLLQFDDTNAPTIPYRFYRGKQP